MMMIDSADDATHLLHASYLHDVTCTRQKSLLKGMRASSERKKEREERKPKPRATDDLGAISSSASAVQVARYLGQSRVTVLHRLSVLEGDDVASDDLK